MQVQWVDLLSDDMYANKFEALSDHWPRGTERGSLGMQTLLPEHTQIRPFPIWPPRVDLTMKSKANEC